MGYYRTSEIAVFIILGIFTVSIVFEQPKMDLVINHENALLSMYKFLAFGGRNTQKHIDLILQAVKIMGEGDFCVYITKGVDTEEVYSKFSDSIINNHVTLIDQVEDVSALYNSIDCFISSSSHETFSYAIAEATFAGIPVIQSDIEGTLWNANNPSAFVFKNGNVSSLAEKMKEVMRIEKEQIREWCKETRDINMKKYSLSSWCNQVISFYEGTEGCLEGKYVLFVCQYHAPYKGNFIKSLEELAKELQRLYKCSICYVFPDKVEQQIWFSDFSKNNSCFLTQGDVEQSDAQLEKIFSQLHPGIIHTHFDGYDVPVVKAVIKSQIDSKIIWHLHDHLEYMSHPLKALYQRYIFYRHYGYYAQRGKVSMIAVAKETEEFVRKFNKSAPISIIQNGIDPNRIVYKDNTK